MNDQIPTLVQVGGIGVAIYALYVLHSLGKEFRAMASSISKLSERIAVVLDRETR